MVTGDDTANVRKGGRNRKQPDRYGFGNANVSHKANMVIKIPVTTSDEPTVHQAMTATPKEVELWIEAIEEELAGLNENGTWKPLGEVMRGANGQVGPKGERLLPTHINLKIKRNEDGLPIRFKARVVAGGNHQIHGEDYDEVYAPVIDFCIVLLFQAIVR